MCDLIPADISHLSSLMFCTRRAYTQSNYRGLISTTDTNLAGNRILEQPVILITKEHSGSNAEMFSEGFRKLGLGKVVGMPTGRCGHLDLGLGSA